jgi:hypothetical protein
MIAILAVSMLGLMIALIAVGVGARKMLTDQTHSKPMRTQDPRGAYQSLQDFWKVDWVHESD